MMNQKGLSKMSTPSHNVDAGGDNNYTKISKLSYGSQVASVPVFHSRPKIDSTRVIRKKSSTKFITSSGQTSRHLLKQAKKLPKKVEQRTKSQISYISQQSNRSSPIPRSFFKCPICLDILVEATTGGCGHIFCGQCLNEWTNTKCWCPLCQKIISKKSTSRIFTVDEVIEHQLPNLSQNIKERWTQAQEQRISKNYECLKKKKPFYSKKLDNLTFSVRSKGIFSFVDRYIGFSSLRQKIPIVSWKAMCLFTAGILIGVIINYLIMNWTDLSQAIETNSFVSFSSPNFSWFKSEKPVMEAKHETYQYRVKGSPIVKAQGFPKVEEKLVEKTSTTIASYLVKILFP